MQILGVILSIYGVIALVYVGTQMGFAVREHLKQNRFYQKRFGTAEGYHDSVSIVVPVYNEDPKILEMTLSSMVKLYHQDPLEIIVIDDGSTNRSELNKVYQKFNHVENMKILLQPENRGKREAQKIGFDKAQGNIIVTIDSDTVFHDMHAIEKLLLRFEDQKVGAVTGDVRVKNSRTNWITRMTKHRYWFAFFQERAAQSLFGIVMCCSGPFSAYRRELIEEVKDDYINEIFFGKKSTFGDDRHLTNLILNLGYRVVFAPYAKAFTFVPETFGGFVRQQVRWSKSFFRESYWLLKNVRNQSWYLYVSVVIQLFLSLFLLISLAFIILQVAMTHNWMILWLYLGVVVLMAVARVIFALALTGDFSFIWFSLYGFVHILLLTPIRVYALFTISKTHWGTR